MYCQTMASHGRGVQEYPGNPKRMRPSVLRDHKTDVLVLSTTDPGDKDIANRFKDILALKGFTTEMLKHDHTHEATNICKDVKDDLCARLVESDKVLLILSSFMAQSPYLEIILNYVQRISQQRRKHMLVICKLNTVNMKLMPRQLRSGSAIVPIQKGRHTEDGMYISFQADELNDVYLDLIEAAIKTNDFSHEIKDVALGLVSSYFFGYLEFKLPALKEYFESTQQTGQQTWDIESGYKLYTKMVILMPESCVLPDTLPEADPKIEYLNNSNREPVKFVIKANKGGVQMRDYSSSVCVIKGTILQNRRDYVCIVEYANPLIHMDKLSKRSLYQYSETNKADDYDKFTNNLNQILETSNDCQDTYLLINYNDEAVKNEGDLSQTIVDAINRDELLQDMNMDIN